MNNPVICCQVATIDELTRKVDAYRELTGVTPRIRLDGIFFDTVHNVVEVKRSDYNVASIEHDYIRLYGVSDIYIQFADIDATVYLS